MRPTKFCRIKFGYKRLIAALFAFVVLFSAIFVNKMTADAKPEYSYKIYINRVQNCVTVYSVNDDGRETPIRSIVCSCAKDGYETPLGVYKTSNYYKWRQLTDGAYGRFAIRINGDILMHSVPYTTMSPDSLEWDQYNKLGTPASRGCIRMPVKDIKWIYDNCKKDTIVVVYDGLDSPGALDKPASIKIDGNNTDCCGWDPTDDDPENPWLTYDPYGITYDTFDAEKYAENNPDVTEVYGNKKYSLWKHYNSYGKYEGRKPF